MSRFLDNKSCSKVARTGAVPHRGRSRYSDMASAAGSRVKWRVPHRCQKRKPARRVGRYRCPRASAQVRSGTPRTVASLPSPPLWGSHNSAAASAWPAPHVRICSSPPQLGHPWFPPRKTLWRKKVIGGTHSYVVSPCECECRVRDSFSGVSRRGVGLKSGTRLEAPLLASVACWRPMRSLGKARERRLWPPDGGLFMITLQFKGVFNTREVRGTSHRTHVQVMTVFRWGAWTGQEHLPASEPVLDLRNDAE